MWSRIALYRLGHLDLSHLADELARAAAVRGDDPIRTAVAEWNHSLILMFDGAFSAGVRSLVIEPQRQAFDAGWVHAINEGARLGAGRRYRIEVGQYPRDVLVSQDIAVEDELTQSAFE